MRVQGLDLGDLYRRSGGVDHTSDEGTVYVRQARCQQFHFDGIGVPLRRAARDGDCYTRGKVKVARLGSTGCGTGRDAA